MPRCPRRIFCERLPAGASADTLLRVLNAPAAKTVTAEPVRVLGVEDRAWRKGRRCGTVLVDPERHRVLGLLPDRGTPTLAAWLRADPGVEFVSRDRGGACAEGAALGAPDTVQAADRFDLLGNLAGAVGEVLERHRRVSRHTIIRWLAVGHFPERRDQAPRPTHVAPHAAYLRERWDRGCHNATRLWRELRDAHGFGGGRSSVRDWITAHLSRARPRVVAATLPRTAHPSPRRAAWLWCKAADTLTVPERVYVDAVCTAAPPLAGVRRLAAGFRAVLADYDVNALTPWLADAERSELRPLAMSLRRDHDALLAAVCFRWSNGQVEGHVNRLKLVKRSMYGRAGPPLPRRRVLAASPGETPGPRAWR